MRNYIIMEIKFDDLWTLKENMKGIKKEIQDIRKRTKSLHIREILIDERINETLENNLRILNKCFEENGHIL
ncbi:MAG: hypothetical protein V3U54_13265 [Thermodesulfobacteriota bacterium]